MKALLKSITTPPAESSTANSTGAECNFRSDNRLMSGWGYDAYPPSLKGAKAGKRPRPLTLMIHQQHLPRALW